MITPYRSADTHEGGGEEPSYVKLAARLKLSPTYAHPDQQALLDKLAKGEISSEECVLELQKEVVKRIGDKKQHELTTKQLDDEQQRAQQQQREQEENEMSRNAGLDEPVIICIGEDDEEDDDEAPQPDTPPKSTATAAVGSAPVPASSSSSSSQLSTTPEALDAGDGEQPGLATAQTDDPATEAQLTTGATADAAAAGEPQEAVGLYGQYDLEEEEEERDANFMD